MQKLVGILRRKPPDWFFPRFPAFRICSVILDQDFFGLRRGGWKLFRARTWLTTMDRGDLFSSLPGKPFFQYDKKFPYWRRMMRHFVGGPWNWIRDGILASEGLCNYSTYWYEKRGQNARKNQKVWPCMAWNGGKNRRTQRPSRRVKNLNWGHFYFV